MGIAAPQARRLMLLSRQHDLEFMMQVVCQRRMQLANQSSMLFMQGQNLAPDSAASRQIEAQTAQIAQVDKMLDMELKRIEVQHKACMTEIESVEKILQKNIESGFKI